MRQSLGKVADPAGVAGLVTVRRVQDQRLLAMRLRRLIADLVRRLAARRHLGHFRGPFGGFRQGIRRVFSEARQLARARGADGQGDRRASNTPEKLAAAERRRRAVLFHFLLFSWHTKFSLQMRTSPDTRTSRGGASSELSPFPGPCPGSELSGVCDYPVSVTEEKGTPPLTNNLGRLDSHYIRSLLQGGTRTVPGVHRGALFACEEECRHADCYDRQEP